MGALLKMIKTQRGEENAKRLAVTGICFLSKNSHLVVMSNANSGTAWYSLLILTRLTSCNAAK